MLNNRRLAKAVAVFVVAAGVAATLLPASPAQAATNRTPDTCLQSSAMLGDPQKDIRSDGSMPTIEWNLLLMGIGGPSVDDTFWYWIEAQVENEAVHLSERRSTNANPVAGPTPPAWTPERVGKTFTVKLFQVGSPGPSAYQSTRCLENTFVYAAAPANPPGAPTDVRATSGSGQANVSWTPGSAGSTATTGYTVQWSSNGGGSWNTATMCTGTSTSCTVTGLTNGASHIFRVSATNSGGTSSWSTSSSPVTVGGGGQPTPPTPPGAPGAPTGVNAQPGNGQATVSWTAGSTGASAVTGYQVQWSSDGGVTWTTASMCTGTSTSCTVTGLTNGTGYLFRVAAVNANGTGPFLPASAPTTVGAPGAPTGVQAVPGNGRVTVSWTPGGDSGSAITGYVVEWSSDGGATWTASMCTGTATTCTESGLANGTGYLFRVAAVNANGTGAWSEPSAAVTPGIETTPRFTG